MNEKTLVTKDVKAGVAAGSVPGFAWVAQLRSNCETLHRMAPCHAVAISVISCLETGGPGEKLAADELSHRLAEEFGFTADVQIEEARLYVRFARRPDVGSGQREPMA